MSEDPDAPVYRLVETINIGVARRVPAGVFAQTVARFLTNNDVPVIGWTVSVDGEVQMSVRMGGQGERVFEFTAVQAQQPVTLAALLNRFRALEAHHP